MTAAIHGKSWKHVVALLLFSASAAFADVRRLEIPKAWYGEALPNGDYAVAIRGEGLVTSHGPVPLPEGADDPLYIRIHPAGIRFAGQSHSGRGSWEWMGTSWRLDSNPAFGVSGLIYDASGILRFSVPGVTGSQGYRYVADGSGRLVTGDETYHDVGRRIFEWTQHGDIIVGQGETGCIALRSVARYLIEPGDCRFVRFNRDGDKLAITMVKLPESKTVILWLTAGELAGFPPEPVFLPPTRPAEPPAPTPQPQIVRLTPAQLNTLKVVRAKYGATVTPEDIGAILNETAWRHRNDAGQRLGLQDKPGGTVAVQPGTGRRIWNGLRIVLANGDHYGGDVCGACSVGRFDVVDADFGGPTDPSLFVAPVDPGGNTTTPPNAPPGDTVEQLKAHIAALEQQVANLTIAEAQALERLRLATEGRIEAERVAAALQTQLVDALAQLEAARQAQATAEAKLAAVGCESKVPGWLRALGVKVGCTVTGR